MTRIWASRPSPSLLWAVGRALLRQPGLWVESARQLRPMASAGYRRFRSVTAYGDPHAIPEVADVMAWLGWARSFRGLSRGGNTGRRDSL